MLSARAPTDPVDEGDAAVSRIIAATGASFVRRSHVMQVLQHPLVGEGLIVYCGPAGLSVSVHWIGAHPSRAVFDLAIKAGSTVTGDPTWLLEPTLAKCRARALESITADEQNASADGFAVGSAEIEGSVYTHDGGGGSFTISQRE